MGIKIKKDVKFQAQKLKPLKIKYFLAVPFIGIADIVTMMSFFFNPSTDGMIGAKIFFLFFAFVGAAFAYWGFMWNVISDNKRVTVNPVIGRVKEVNYDRIKKVEVHKKKKRGSLAYFTLIGMDDEIITKIYPIMTNSGEFFNRLIQLEIKMEEFRDA